MKVLFISDIHANYSALKTIENQIIDSDLTICLGDIVGYHCHVNEVIEIIRKHDVKCILGNHDFYLLNGIGGITKKINESVRFGLNIAERLITKDNLDWLNNLPINFGLRLDGTSVLCCHGSPWNPVHEYIYEDSEKIENLKSFNYDFIALGHTHRQYNVGDAPVIFNPGSVGQARDFEGIVCTAELDTANNKLEFRQFDYDFKAEIEYSLKYGAKEWIYKHFKSRL
ncbi:MAG: metallophosphoesterase family protein [Proteiniphilum sp.]|nr:metallophosphoesterase family protein [Bacteroidales bacterium]